MLAEPSSPFDLYLVDLARAMQRKSLYQFVGKAFEVLNPAERFVPNWHIEAMCFELERVARGENVRLLITVPPRHAKTICTSIALPAWMLGHNPSIKVIAATYGQALSSPNFRALCRVMQSDWYRELFPQTVFGVAGSTLSTTSGGNFIATSVDGAVTGFGADLIIADDLMKAGEATSPTERDRAWDFFQQSLLTRFNDRNTGRIVAIQQRLHEDDPAGRMIESGTFFNLNLPAISEEAQRVQLAPNRFHDRRKDDVLFPQRQSRETLHRTKLEQGSHNFSAQYQQNPVAPGSSRLDWSKWQAREFPDLDEFQLVVQSWDTGMSAEPTSDFSACTTWGFYEREWYLLDVFRQRMDFSDLKQRVLHMRKQWKADFIIVESAATGKPLIRALHIEHDLRSVVLPYIPKLEKLIRFETQVARLDDTPHILPIEATWLPEFKREIMAFPNGKHDDMVDSMTQFLHWTGMRGGLAKINFANGQRRPRRHR